MVVAAYYTPLVLDDVLVPVEKLDSDTMSRNTSTLSTLFQMTPTGQSYTHKVIIMLLPNVTFSPAFVPASFLKHTTKWKTVTFEKCYLVVQSKHIRCTSCMQTSSR